MELACGWRFNSVELALGPMVAEVHRAGSARGLIAVYSTLGLLKLRLGALPDADAAARVALRALQEGDFVPGLAFAATVLADVAVEAGELDEAQALIGLLPQEGWPAGVGTVLIPAARGRLRVAQGRPADALGDFQTCAAMFSPEVWGTEMRDVGYVHARAGAAQALLRLGEREAARQLAQAELDDVRVFGAPRALGISSRVAGLAEVLADDVVFTAPGGMRGEGKPACVKFYGSWHSAFPDAHVEVHSVHFIDDIAVEEGTFSGTHNGILHTPTGDIPPTGRAVGLDYIHVLRFRDGKHVSFSLMFDRLLMLEQLGLIPAPAAASH